MTSTPGPVVTTGVSHVRLTVRDLTTSRRFYDALFGWDVAVELPADADDATRERLWFLFGGIIYSTPFGLLGLRPVAAAHDSFSEDRVGLDHLSFAVADRAALDGAVEVLDSLGAPHEGVKDAGGLWILEFRDPDGIALELAAPRG
ncbi:VOC family protein [Kineococcus rhizosphaerae]|uniref:Catechol 2,3-dioxygenase-like lactoylglutathione lyase family enzyme n=1 Tax=Kineococcus rhizosphaerae TaxID=559628 RepID=A0A2T0R7X9_9ACTN|nr:VOC family protein [Kineococcus rhizosphaerae]PRY17276.1 catechol 2,3-dioxygenase-like lactoylglutathione lyase family enzyme [Kineococcus rhizosphaerae]